MRMATVLFLAAGAAVIGLLLWNRSHTVPDGMQLFVLAGQSNMSGRGDLADLPSDFPVNGERIWVLSNADVWRPAREPLDSADQQVDSVSVDVQAAVGPGLAFADRLAEQEHGHIGLVPCAKGATPIRDWLPSSSRDTLYGSCVRRIKEAQTRGKLKAVLFYQGESDADTPENARLWTERFSSMVSGFRYDLADPELMFIVIVLAKTTRAQPVFAHWSSVQAAQRATADIRNVVVVEAEAYALRPDGLHLSTKGQLQLGIAIADQLRGRRDFK